MESWEELFAALEAFDEEQTEQKRKGLNDFNLLSSVLSVNDEVRLQNAFDGAAGHLAGVSRRTR
ncbi:hypothetical protein [Paenalcaligenes faecalis]|uniref:hypothetical protein n=1 Tax=Paenalcaligenes faecalis TaxID=2980099 RepID=UPI0022B94741|nr:hypothetical protein [Paenalcaligenes faecalis]